ncbi:hypothetical protein JM83_2408 [Gillisia sp. Hel_I_86]|uniref:DUF6702 family protein n=1 Tax=Gillisia sp. Hel_I_86 TaxID=1249981 RepID=UPI00119970CB|nr:DUF6702 family protein [Gillisia sp. Hel_I_86]TVZ27371.1 hypothetical protein JM83_2408 [Gillisia sp. Hel_I_86]
MKIKLALVLLFIGFSSFKTNHKFYVSVTEIEYNEKAESLQIISRVFIDDLEDLLQTRYDKSIRLGKSNESTEVHDYIKKYLNKKIEVQLDGKSVEVNYLGKEYEDDMVLLYLEISKVSSFKKIGLKNALLTDMFSEQKNLVHVTYKGSTKSLILNKAKQEDVLNFSD